MHGGFQGLRSWGKWGVTNNEYRISFRSWKVLKLILMIVALSVNIIKTTELHSFCWYTNYTSTKLLKQANKKELSRLGRADCAKGNCILQKACFMANRSVQRPCLGTQGGWTERWQAEAGRAGGRNCWVPITKQSGVWIPQSFWQILFDM